MSELDALQMVCDALNTGDRDTAMRVSRTYLQFNPHHELRRRLRAPKSRSSSREYEISRVRKLTVPERLEIFCRDGFVDRYEGGRLVFPGVLWLITGLLPDEFPYQPHWKLIESHHLWYYHSPTVDHIIPVVRGGTNAGENLLTTSMLNNMEKGNNTLAEVRWKVLPAGKLGDWDGLLHWFVSYVEKHPSAIKMPHVAEWRRAIRKILKI